MSADPIFVALTRSLRADPADQVSRLALADWLEEHGGPKSEVRAALTLRAGRVPLTDLDKVAAAALSNCRFLPGSFAKRFARDLQDAVPFPAASLTPKQYALLWKLCHQYRRQIRDQRILAEAEAVHALRAGLPAPAERRPAPGELPLAGPGP